MYSLVSNSMAYETGGSMRQSQGLSNNLYPEPNHPNSSYWYLFLRPILILSSYLRLGLPEGLLPVAVKMFLHPGYMTCPSQSSWVLTFASGSCFQIPLSSIPPVMLETTFHNYVHNWQYYCFIYFNFQVRRKGSWNKNLALKLVRYAYVK